MAATPFYTVDSWASLPAQRTMLIDGDAKIADGVDALHTAGHTRGHQAVVIRSTHETTVIAGQCVFRAAEWHDLEPSAANLHDPDHRLLAADSIARLRALHPTRILLSHDESITIDQHQHDRHARP